MFLTRSDLRRLTGTTRPAEQMRTLRSQGISFYTDINGRPVVTWAMVNGTAGNGGKINWGALDDSAAA